MCLARSRPTVLNWFMDASWRVLEHPHSGRLMPSRASTWGNRGSELPHRSDGVGAGVEPTAALPIMMVSRGRRAIARAWALPPGG